VVHDRAGLRHQVAARQAGADAGRHRSLRDQRGLQRRLARREQGGRHRLGPRQRVRRRGLLSALGQEGKKTGLASLCIGGGEAVALVVERL
jgi:hypothetical protein